MIREEIKKLIEKAVKNLYKEEVEVKIERPAEAIYGDYSTNIAMALKRKPQEIADSIKSSILDRVEVKNGFINFFISKEYLQKQIKEVFKKGEKFGQLKIGKNQKIQVEFISANPTGPLTVGNARGGAFGDCLANVLQKAGYKTKKEYYVNDCGKQILMLGNSVLKNREAIYKGDYIEILHKKIKEKNPHKAGQIAAREIVEEIIKKTVKNFGIKYDNWFFESSLHAAQKVEKTIAYLQKKKLIYKKDGALWFKSKEFGDIRDRVLVKKDGEKTYLAADIAYHRYKFEEKNFDKAINIWGADHYGDVPGLQAGVAALGHKGKLNIILLQFVTIFEKGKAKKMSKRKGTFVALDDLLGAVGKDAARFFFLEKSGNAHLNFDLDLAREQSEKNPVYYIQYAYARINSILAKYKMQNTKRKIINQNLKLLNHQSELNLIEQLIRFPEVIEDTASDYQIQRIPKYALGLANNFHKFYQDCRVIGENKELERDRICLVMATKIILKNTLNIMGISAPEKM